MRKGLAHLFLILALPALSLAQIPRFPLPNNSDQDVKNAAQGSRNGEPGYEAVVAPEMLKYISTPAEPHPLGCNGGVPPIDTESAWKVDADSSMFGSLAQTGGSPTQKFLGCFEPNVKWDGPSTTTCFGIPFSVPPMEICYDGDDETCSQNTEILKAPGCDIPDTKNNKGYHLRYWWPENEVEIHNYQRVIFDPLYECGQQQYKESHITSFLQQFAAQLTQFTPADSNITAAGIVTHTANQAGIPRALRMDPHIGESHWGGIFPGDQTFAGESHIWRTYVNTLSALNEGGTSRELGYKRDCRCFYSSVMSQTATNGKARKIVNGWTELNLYLPFWRTYQYSQFLDPYQYQGLELFQSIKSDTCASMRAFNQQLGSKDYKYEDLAYALGAIRPFPQSGPLQPPAPIEANALWRICYKGAGDLFPITGQLIGHFSPLPASAYLARRALYMFGKDMIWSDKTHKNRPFVPLEEVINKYSDNDDKMQRIYPLNGNTDSSECFRTQEIPNYLQEGGANWPKNLIQDAQTNGPAGPNDSPRFLYWNKREAHFCPYLGETWGLRIVGSPVFFACGPAGDACHKDDEGDYEDSDTGHLGGYGHGSNPMPMPDGIPYPFLPKYGAGMYTTDPIHGDDPAVCQIVGGCVFKPGQCDLNAKKSDPVHMHRFLPEWLTTQGGLQCPQKDVRCDGAPPPP